MIPALVSLKSLIKTKSYHIDYPLFRLHYQATVCALLAFCLILTAKILFGDTIDCKSRMLARDDFYDNQCFAQGTYTMYAIDGDDLRKIAAIQHGYTLQETPTTTPGTIQIEFTKHDLHPDISDKLPKPSSRAPLAVESPSTSRRMLDKNVSNEDLGIVPRIASFLYDLAGFNNEEDPTQRVKKDLVTITKNNVTNYTYSLKTFPDEFLSNSNIGEFFKNNFRSIHQMMKSNNFKFLKDVKYMYSGIMIPKPTGDMYSTVLWHRYYQYIPIILFLQAVLFYFPHYLWKCWENGVIASICKQLHENRFTPCEYIDSNYQIVDYLQNCFVLNKWLVYKYYFCQLLMLVNLLTQIIVLNAIFNNQFVTYGIDVFTYLFIDKDVYGLRSYEGNNEDLNNPMDFVFPKVTACTTESLSQAGLSPDRNQFLCILPLNILHDKFFLILWFWFLILGVVTVVQIMFDILYTTMPAMRKYLFKRKFGPYLSEGNKHSSSLQELFMLDLIGSNSDRFAFSALLRRLNKDDWQISSSPEHQSLV